MKDRCTVADGDIRCVLPAGHPGELHEYKAALPPDVAQYVAAYIEALDAAEQDLRKNSRRASISWRISIGVIAVYIVLAVYNLVQALS